MLRRCVDVTLGLLSLLLFVSMLLLLDWPQAAVYLPCPAWVTLAIARARESLSLRMLVFALTLWPLTVLCIEPIERLVRGRHDHGRRMRWFGVTVAALAPLLEWSIPGRYATARLLVLFSAALLVSTWALKETGRGRGSDRVDGP